MLLAIVVLALGVRVFVAAQAEMISRDGAKFIWYAQGLGSDPLAEMRSQDQHPLYPALILATHKVLEGVRAVCGVVPDDPIQSWSLAGVIVTLAGSAAVIIATYLLAQTLFDMRVGIIAAMLAAASAEFCQLSADVLSDMPHMAVYLLAMTAGIKGVVHQKRLWLFIAGALSGTAFLIRPEGAEVAMALAVGVVLLTRSWTMRQRTIGILVVCIGAAIIASPYMAMKGKLVPKKSIKQMLWGDDSEQALGDTNVWNAPAGQEKQLMLKSAAAPISVCASCPCIRALKNPTWLFALGRVAEYWVRALRVTFLLPIIVWLIRRRDPGVDRIGAQLVLAAFFLHVLIAVALIIRFDYWTWFSLRHVMILAGLTLPFSAAGIVAILNIVPFFRRRIAAVILAISLVGPTVPWMLETRNADQMHIGLAGQWIREHSEGAIKPVVMTDRHRAAFYANGSWIGCPPEAEVDQILPEARYRRPQWLVFEEKRCLKAVPDFFERLERSAIETETLQRAHVVSDEDNLDSDRVIIYRYKAPGLSTTSVGE